MEFQKHCIASASDAARSNQSFLATVVSLKWAPEAFHTLRRYMSTMPDAKTVINLQLHSQKFVDAGMTMTQRALWRKSDPREKQSNLVVSSIKIIAITICVGHMINM